MRILGFCLEWLRNKDNGSGDVVRRINRSYECLLPAGQRLLKGDQLKVWQSVLSSGEWVPNHIKYDIHQHCMNLLIAFSAKKRDY